MIKYEHAYMLLAEIDRFVPRVLCFLKILLDAQAFGK